MREKYRFINRWVLTPIMLVYLLYLAINFNSMLIMFLCGAIFFAIMMDAIEWFMAWQIRRFVRKQDRPALKCNDCKEK